jgi:Dolichyl-phosphate-mannose-protein mannosyltransferase
MKYMRPESTVKDRSARNDPAFRLAEAAWYIAALVSIVIAGIVKLEFPLGRDQALFLLYAMGLDRGASLYVDLWDFKPPGIFWFYLTAGRLFGFNERGVHLLELMWLLALSVLMMVALRDYFRHKWLSAVAPVAAVGVYYVFARFDQATQVEILAALPIFASIWLLSRAYVNDHMRIAPAYFAGVAGAVATVFKLVYAPLIIIFVCFALYACYRQNDRPIRAMVYLLAWFTTGVLTIWVPVCLTSG